MKPHVHTRWILESLMHALTIRRVVVLEGGRQSGKTTLVKKLGKKNIYNTLDDITLLQAAHADPHGFVKHGAELMIIDEIQRAPELLLAIKKEVDEHPVYGRFLLTGSANIQTLPGVTESLAGRMKKIRLRPLTTGEIKGNNPDFLKNLPVGPFPSLQNNIYDKDAYLKLALRGGYPEAVSFNTTEEAHMWYLDYVNAMIERDLKDILNIRRKDSLQKLMTILAAWSSKLMDITKITSHLSISRATVEAYINALESLYIVERVKPWFKTDYDRVGKQDKLFLVDTGLMASLLSWNFEDIRLDGEKTGKLLETFVFTQLAAIIDADPQGNYQLYHYRDRDKREIDFIIEDNRGEIIAIEVKAGSVVTKKSFKHIEWFMANMCAQHNTVGIVLYTGGSLIRFGTNLLAVPIACLF